VIRVPVLFFLVFPVVVELVVVFGFLGVRIYVGEGARAFAKEPVVIALLEAARLTKSSRTSFSGHVVTCLEVVAPLCRAARGGYLLPGQFSVLSRTADVSAEAVRKG